MAPLAEKDDVVVVGKVWRRDEEVQRSPAEAPALAPASAPAPARIRPATARKAAAAAAAAQATSAAQATRTPRAAPAPRVRRPTEKGGAPQWAAGARDPAGLTPAGARKAAPAVTAETGPADIARDERQALARPAAGPASHAAPAAGPGPTGRPGPVGRPSPVGRHAARPTLRASVPGLDTGNEERVTRHARPDGTDRPSGAAWPVKDPHAPANAPAAADRAPARPPWTSSGHRPRYPRYSGTWGSPARSAGSAVPPCRRYPRHRPRRIPPRQQAIGSRRRRIRYQR